MRIHLQYERPQDDVRFSVKANHEVTSDFVPQVGDRLQVRDMTLEVVRRQWHDNLDGVTVFLVDREATWTRTATEMRDHFQRAGWS